MCAAWDNSSGTPNGCVAGNPGYAARITSIYARENFGLAAAARVAGRAGLAGAGLTTGATAITGVRCFHARMPSAAAMIAISAIAKIPIRLEVPDAMPPHTLTDESAGSAARMIHEPSRGCTPFNEHRPPVPTLGHSVLAPPRIGSAAAGRATSQADPCNMPPPHPLWRPRK